MSLSASLVAIHWRDWIDLAALERGLMGTRLAVLERIPVGPDAAARAARRAREAGLAPQAGLLLLPREGILFRGLDFPAVAGESLADVIAFEADKHVPLPEEERTVGYQSAPAPRQGRLEVLLLAARAEAVEAAVRPFREAGLPLDRALPFSAALAPALEGAAALLVLDGGRAEAAVVEGGHLLASTMVDPDAAGLAADRLSAVLQELVAAHRARLGPEGIAAVYVLGPDEPPAELESVIATDLGAPPRGAKALAAALRPPELEEGAFDDLPEAGALAAALLEERAGAADLLHAPPRKRRRPVAPLCFAVFAVAAVLFGAALVGQGLYRKMRMRARLDERIAALAPRVEAVDRERDRVRALREALEDRLSLLDERVGAMEILRDLTEALDKDTYLTRLALSQGSRVNLGGWSKAPNAIPGKLEPLPSLRDVAAPVVSRTDGEYKQFSLAARVEREEGGE